MATSVPSTSCSATRVEIFDPVEFDPALRLIDVGADLAFLVMELIEADREDLARVLQSEYRLAGGNDGGDALTGFYASLPSLGPLQGRMPALRGARG